MFSKAYLKLAGFYLLIIMTISLLFSFSLYFVSVNELQRGANAQGSRLLDVLGRPPRPVEQQRLADRQQEALSEARSRVIGRLVIVNLGIMVVAGGLSYYLARRTLRPIEEAHHSLERFTADASHELRTPITAMTSEIEVTLSDPKLDLKEAKKQLNSNLEELGKLTALSDGLLRLAQVDSSNLPDQPVRISEVVNTAIDRVSNVAKKHKIDIVAPSDNKFYTTGDQASLTEGLVTILDNAIKYSPQKSKVTIEVSSHRHHLRIVIADSGLGIKASELPHIFERFYRADSSRSKTNTDGYGLGLAIAKSIFELHGGTITVQSKPQQGSKFIVTLPKK